MLLVITGGTCTGKDTLVKELLNTGKFKRLLSHTTRPMREGEQEGKDYFFHNTDKDITTPLCYKEYTVASGDKWKYWFEEADVLTCIESDEWYVCIADSDGALVMKELISESTKDNTLKGAIVMVKSPVKQVLERYYNREKKNPSPNYEEVIRRILADDKDYNMTEFHLMQQTSTEKVPVRVSYNTGDKERSIKFLTKIILDLTYNHIYKRKHVDDKI